MSIKSHYKHHLSLIYNHQEVKYDTSVDITKHTKLSLFEHQTR